MPTPTRPNSTLAGLPTYLFRRLQSVLNASARLIYAGLGQHAVHALTSLHWLRIPERVKFKLAVLIHRVLLRTAPVYHEHSARCEVSDLPAWSSFLEVSFYRSARHSTGYTHLSTVDPRPFAVAGPSVWNSLPAHITRIGSLWSSDVI